MGRTHVAATVADPDEFNPFEAPEPAQVRRPAGEVGPYIPRGDDPGEVELFRYDLGEVSGWALLRGTAYARYPLSKRPVLTSFLMLGFFAFFGGYIGGMSLGRAAIPLCAIVAIEPSLFKFVALCIGIRKSRRIVRSLGVQTISAAPGYLAIRNAHTDIKLTWAVISRFVANRHDLLLFGPSSLLLNIPRAVFASPDEAAEFIREIRSRLPGEK
jgi:hypothetical protein